MMLVKVSKKVRVRVNPYSIAERRVPKLIPVLDSQPAGDVTVGCHYFLPGCISRQLGQTEGRTLHHYVNPAAYTHTHTHSYITAYRPGLPG